MIDYEPMEMPTPCQECKKIFDLHDGYRSEKWHPDVVICEDCHRKEQEEIEQDEFWESINYELEETLSHLKEPGAWDKLTKENQLLIKNLLNGWIEFKSNKELFNTEAKKNCLCMFEDGTVINYNDEHPMQIMTHFKLAE